MSEINSKILSLIEASIKKGNADINNFALNLITNLKKLITPEDFQNLVEKNLSDKKIYFIRHAESLHNVLEQKYAFKEDMDKWNVLDPKLTEKGIQQTNKTIEKIKDSGINFEAVFVSPLSRTIQTYFLIEKELDKEAKIFVTDFVRELMSYLDKNKGKKLSVLKEEFKDTKLNFEFMTKEFWWFDLGKNKENEYEGKDFSLRLKLFALWLAFRPEKYMLIISHSHVFVEMQDSEGIRNADMVKMYNKYLLVNIVSLMKISDQK